ncbi:MAG: hypothetical protein SFU83_19520 [Meiothermus sp.]|nr:hypothetical protein [Meiothermus sp.]
MTDVLVFIGVFCLIVIWPALLLALLFLRQSQLTVRKQSQTIEALSDAVRSLQSAVVRLESDTKTYGPN